MLVSSRKSASVSPELADDIAVVGYVADRVQSRRTPFILGLIALGGGTALLCVGTTLGLWIAGRIVLGVSGAVVWTVGLAILVDTIGRDGIGQAMGYTGMAITVGMLGGPLLGGVVYGKGGYYAVFGMSFGLIALDIFFRLVMIERKDAVKWLETEKPPSEQTDEKRAGALAESNADAAVSERNPGHEPETAPQKTKYGRVATLLSSERIVVTIWGYFIVSVIFTSFDSVLPIFTKLTFNWKQTAQGVIFIPLELPQLIGPLIGFIIDRYPSSRRYLGAAAFFSAVPTFVLLRFVSHNTTEQKVLLCALLALVGTCIALALIPLMVEVTYAVMAREEQSPHVFGKGGAMALAYGLLNSAFAAGSIIGPFLAGFIRVAAGWGTMAWALALITGLSGVPVLLFMDGVIWKRHQTRM